MSPDGGRIIVARSPLEILRTFFPFVPLRVYVIFAFSTLAGGALFVVVLREFVSEQAAWQWGVLSGLVAGGAVSMVTVVEWCHRLADCYFEIQNEVLEIRAPTMSRILTASWPVSMIQEFVLESWPTILEDLASERVYGASEILGGSQRPEKILRIRTIDGGESEFRMMNCVFDLAAINAIVNELARRGVKISRVTKNLE